MCPTIRQVVRIAPPAIQRTTRQGASRTTTRGCRFACHALIIAGLFAAQWVAARGIFQCEPDDKLCEAVSSPVSPRRPAAPPAATPGSSGPSAPVQRKLWIDPERDAKLLKARIERALSNRAKDTTTWQGAAPGCRDIVEQIAREQPSVHSLRADTRAQAREKLGRFAKTFQERGC